MSFAFEINTKIHSNQLDTTDYIQANYQPFFFQRIVNCSGKVTERKDLPHQDKTTLQVNKLMYFRRSEEGTINLLLYIQIK